MFAMIYVGTGTQINTRYSSGPSGIALLTIRIQFSK